MLYWRIKRAANWSLAAGLTLKEFWARIRQKRKLLTEKVQKHMPEKPQ